MSNDAPTPPPSPRAPARRLAIFGGSFNPPGEHHRAAAARLAESFDEVIVVPCGPRPDKPVTNDVDPIYRATMADMNFRGIPRIRVELFDLEAGEFTRTRDLETRYASEGEVWHVVGSDLVRGGEAASKIRNEWTDGARLWRDSRFVVLERPDFALDSADLPPRHEVVPAIRAGASSDIRDLAYRGRPFDHLVTPDVLRYIERHALYRPGRPRRSSRLRLERPRIRVLFDEASPAARAMASRFPRAESLDAAPCRPASPPEPAPDLIVVVGGDGAMLRAIRTHWRARVPFYGINTGRRGFLLNQPGAPEFDGRDLVLRQLPLLRVETVSPEGETRAWTAFNDAWVERARGQSAWVEVRIDGRTRIERLVADGALVATAQGSTAYARAMGATPLPLNTPALLFVGSNVLEPELLKPAVLPLDASIELIGLAVERRPLAAFIDGVPVGEVASIRARVSPVAAAELAFDPEFDPAEKLARIQFPLP